MSMSCSVSSLPHGDAKVRKALKALCHQGFMVLYIQKFPPQKNRKKGLFSQSNRQNKPKNNRLVENKPVFQVLCGGTFIVVEIIDWQFAAKLKEGAVGLQQPLHCVSYQFTRLQNLPPLSLLSYGDEHDSYRSPCWTSYGKSPHGCGAVT